MACLPLVLGLTFPPAFQGLTHLLGVLALKTFGLQCLGEFDYVDYLFGVTILALLVLGGLLLCFKRVEVYLLLHWKTAEDPLIERNFQAKVAHVAHLFIFLFLPAICCVIFRMFPCQVREHTLAPSCA